MSAPAGPYVAGQRRPCDDCNGDGGALLWEDGRVVASETCATCDEGYVVVSRWAYATLEEARDAVARQCGGADWTGYADWRVHEHGSDPINRPNGDVIKVEATSYESLLAALPSHQFVLNPDVPAAKRYDILAAWNAEHGIPGQEGADRG